MIRFKEWVSYEYFIDPKTAVITDKNGVVQKIWQNNDRNVFQGIYVYLIQAHTAWGYQNGYVVHHKDGNSLNDSIDNLVYMTIQEHSKLHNVGEKNAFYGKHHSKETWDRIKEKLKGRHWWNNGVKQMTSKECPGEGWVRRQDKIK